MSATHWHEINPFLNPDWRWERVCTLVNQTPYPRRCSRHDDQWIRGARAFFLQRHARGSDESVQRLYDENPDLSIGWRIYEQGAVDPGVEFTVQARLLAGQSFDVVAEKVRASPGAIEWYGRLFFDVMDSLHRHDWVYSRVLVPAILDQYGPSADRGRDYGLARPIYDASLKLFAFFGGPGAIEFLLYGGIHPSQAPASASIEDVHDWLDGVWKSMIRNRSARTAAFMGISFESALSLFTMHSQLVGLAAQQKGDRSAMLQGLFDGMNAVVQSVPFVSGELGAKQARQRGLVELDASGYELRAGELIDAGLGKTPVLPGAPPR